ncbi:type VI secretion protein [Sphingobium sp. C100]|uniref:DUF3363 domain-containing protein n=1 Tax=Sphingobium sp. C100 TaxID=1207055 RepID=UPI0003D6626B|nr:DUF3363 domain-containing protein [Sphingobium sp. C100]ETI64967.1 type VI secretion protein [Sphingobium sp. C100]
MAGSDDDRFRPRLGKPRGGGTGPLRFTSKVLRAAGKAGPPRGQRRRTNAARLGRGAIAARLMRQGLARADRRVVIKVRSIQLGKVSPRSTRQHLAYVERDAVGPQGEPGLAYDRGAERVDTGAFEERGRGDRHQFRIIVAPEDGEALGDLRSFTRSLMARVEADLETRLDWVAVDHHDTGNPHTHILLRGVREDGQDLVIARDYVSRGMRMRASEVATETLGPRTEREIAHMLARDTTADRWTGIDRALMRGADAKREVAPEQVQSIGRNAGLGRLRHLQTLGLADPVAAGRWRLAERHEPVLRQLGERVDIIRTLQRAIGEPREIALPDERGVGPLIGRIAGKGLVDELGDATWLAVDGVDGRAHYARVPAGADPADWPVGGIVEIDPGKTRDADRTIAALAEDGIYSVERHRAAAAADERPGDPARYVEAHVRRLEALRRAGHVERISDDLWRVPADLADKGRSFDRARGGGLTLRSRLSIGAQIGANGATWLDRTLLAGGERIAGTGFGAEVHKALGERTAFLERSGLARRQNGRLLLARDLLDQLRERDLGAAGQAIAAQTGLAYRPVQDGAVAGTYVRSVDRPSGRFAMLDDGSGGFALVPWRPVIEQRLGQWIGGVARGGDIDWKMGRSQGLGV